MLRLPKCRAIAHAMAGRIYHRLQHTEQRPRSHCPPVRYSWLPTRMSLAAAAVGTRSRSRFALWAVRR